MKVARRSPSCVAMIGAAGVDRRAGAAVLGRAVGRAATLLGVLLAAGCAGVPTAPSGGRGAQAPGSECAPRSASGGYYLDDGPGRNAPADPAAVPDAVPRPEPLHPYANRPYTVFGRAYIPLTDLTVHRERGRASWYGCKFHGRPTSSGERYDMYGMTAAHPTLPIPSYVRVTNLRNGRSVVVRVNDRGPFLNQRVIDLSYTAAARLGYVEAGSAEVEVEWLPMRADMPMLAERAPATARTGAARAAREAGAGPGPAKSATPVGSAAAAANGPPLAAATTASAATASVGTASVGTASVATASVATASVATASVATASVATASAATASAATASAATASAATASAATASAASAVARSGSAASPAGAVPASAAPAAAISPMLAEAQLERLQIETTIDERRPEPAAAVASTPPASAASTASSGPGAGTWLQFGVFGSRENAEALGARLRRELPWLGVPVEVFASGEAWRVHVGPWSRRDDAVATAARIAAATSLRAIPVAR
jgi:rare lipoprotein A